MEDSKETVVVDNKDESSSSTPNESENSKSDDILDACSVSILSKRQKVRLRKQQVALQYRGEKRKKERERKKLKRLEAKEKGIHIEQNCRKRLRKNAMKDSSCKLQVAIDCSFDEYMNDWDINNLGKQIQYCYSANRRAENPLQFYVTGFCGRTKSRLEAIQGYENWDVNFKEEKYDKLFENDKVVYLSSESENMLTELDHKKTYIIGGLIDHNHQKGLCHRLAIEKEISHAQLPISQFLEMKTRKVLTINHVFEILVKFTEIGDWGKAFFQVIPQRKGAVIKNNSDTQYKDGTETGNSSKDNSDSSDSATHSMEDKEQQSDDCAPDEVLHEPSDNSEHCLQQMKNVCSVSTVCVDEVSEAVIVSETVEIPDKRTNVHAETKSS